MQKTMFLAAAAAATLTLAACNSEPETITANRFDPMAEALEHAPPVTAPPTIEASRTYRCRDNSLVYIDFLSNATALVRTTQGGAPDAVLTAEGGNPPYTGNGYSVSANAARIDYTAPGRSAQSCRA